MRADRAVDGPSAVAEKRADRDVEASTQINEVWVKARAKSDIRARDVRWVALEHTENEDVPQAVSDRMVRGGHHDEALDGEERSRRDRGAGGLFGQEVPSQRSARQRDPKRRRPSSALTGTPPAPPEEKQ